MGSSQDAAQFGTITIIIGTDSVGKLLSSNVAPHTRGALDRETRQRPSPPLFCFFPDETLRCLLPAGLHMAYRYLGCVLSRALCLWGEAVRVWCRPEGGGAEGGLVLACRGKRGESRVHLRDAAWPEVTSGSFLTW